jgi:hypothetical protein
MVQIIAEGVPTICLVQEHLQPNFLQHTGFASCLLDTTLQTALNLYQVPSVVVLRKGHKVAINQELALEWNDPSVVVEHWRKGESALTSFQALAVALTCVIL